MQTFPEVVSVQSFDCISNTINYINSSFNQNNNSTEILRQSIPETKSINSLPLIASNLSPQWILNPFCSSSPLMTTTTTGNQSLNSSEMTSLLSSNFFASNNANQLSTTSLGTSLDMTLASVSANNNTNNSHKEIIRLKTCSLYPPKPNLPICTSRERPLGCRTVFIGGLPENITEDILREVFEVICGDICAIRLSKKNFCHIRFESEKSIDSAIGLSGHRLKISDSDDATNTGRLHVDYAQARDDQYEWECKQRALQRQMRHRVRLEYDRFCPPSPPTVHYSDHEAIQMIEDLKCDQNYLKAIQELTNWLERGECQKRNCNLFYSLIQTTNNHIKRLQTERTVYENEWIISRELYHSRMQSILDQFIQIEKVFESATKQKAWDHFTKAQRKHIDLWFKQMKEAKSAQVEDVLNKREEDEMDLSDGENDSNIGISCDSMDKSNREMSFRDENDSLKCQIQSLQNEALFVEQESRQERERLEKQITLLQQALQGMQHQLIALNHQKRPSDEERHNRNEMTSNDREESCSETMSPSKTSLIISLISIYFNVHPFGTTSHAISAYLSQQTHIRDENILSSHFIDSFLAKFPNIFSQIEIDSKGRKLWKFCGFNSI